MYDLNFHCERCQNYLKQEPQTENQLKRADGSMCAIVTPFLYICKINNDTRPYSKVPKIEV